MSRPSKGASARAPNPTPCSNGEGCVGADRWSLELVSRGAYQPRKPRNALSVTPAKPPPRLGSTEQADARIRTGDPFITTPVQGRVLVDASLRSVSHRKVFAAGDSAWPVTPVGVGTARPSAYASTIMGAQAGTNLARELAGEPVKPLRFGYLMQSVSLGRTDGLVQFTNGNDEPLRVVATGRVAAQIKEFVERIVVVGSLRAERLLPGAYAWRPAPRSARLATRRKP